MNLKPKLVKDLKKNVVKKKTILSPRSPLQHLNGAAAGSISSSTTSSRDGFGSSSLSTKASKLVHNSKTARAAPSCFRSNKSVKVNRLRTNHLRRNSNIGSKQKKTLKEVKSTQVEQTCTPACNNKVVRLEEEENSTSRTKNTPPVQISVSPEIQGGLSISVNGATISCYGASHLLHGVTDRRKCRPGGILAVGNKSGCINGENNADLHEFSTTTSSLIMEPLEASMRWLSNNGDEKNIPGLFSLSSPFSSGQGIDSSMLRTEKTRVAPPATPSCDDLLKGNNRSLFSINSLCSDNVVQTPESDSIFNHYSKGDDHCSEPQQLEMDSSGDRCSFDCSSVKELFEYKLSLSLRDGINETEEEPNFCRYLSDNDDKNGNESFGFGIMKGEEPIPPKHKATIFAESITIDGDSISDLFSRSSNQS